MGVISGYDMHSGKWYIKGFMCRKEYDTLDEMNADKARMLSEHFKNIDAFQISSGLLRRCC